MLAWFKDLVAPIRTNDGTFGDMRYLRDSSMWEGNAHFGPVGHLIEILISSDERGPTDEHRA